MTNSIIPFFAIDQKIKAHLEKYYSLISTGKPFRLSEIIDTYLDMDTAMSKHAFNYAFDRLPAEIENIPKIFFIKDNNEIFSIDSRQSQWRKTSAKNRRRFSYYNQLQNILVFQIASDSDIDDIINCLIAYQIEKNKPQNPKRFFFQKEKKLNINFEINYLEDKNSNYFINADKWMKETLDKSLILDIASKPIYFVSSNMHSLVNVTGGFVYHYQNEIFNYIISSDEKLKQSWLEIKESNNILRVNDFLYYISGKYFKDNKDQLEFKKNYERDLGIVQFKANNFIEASIQIIPVNSIAKSKYLDPYINIPDKEKIMSSGAYIVNIEYPLGYAAYFILNEILQEIHNIRGVYVMGKAAILSGEIGDVQVPISVFDERSGNTISIDNIFNNNFPKTSIKSNILLNQKASSVYGTFLENINQLKQYHEKGINIIEMESGPYLNAIYQYINKIEQLPLGKEIILNKFPFDFGIINYASDNPLSQTLGEGQMNMKGIEPTYLASLAIIQRIIDLESSSTQ
jgi:hypothetical protein